MDTFEQDLIAWLARVGKGYALSLTRDKSRADDLMQDVALKALRARHSFAPGTNFSAWMVTIMRNMSIQSYRGNAGRRRRMGSIDDCSETFVAEAPVQEGRTVDREVMSFIGQLHPHQSWVLVGAIEGLNYEEMAFMGGCTIGTVKSRLWRARTRMRAVMGKGPPLTAADETAYTEDVD